tara:strand:- start:139 stop:795 length:657 start_codon:yes stop_codon:yes gene_type:complete
MNFKLIALFGLSTISSFLTPLNLKAEGQGCSGFAAPSETKFVARGNGLFTFIVTEEAAVRRDDSKQRTRALKVAQLRGKKSISTFIKENIESKESFDEQSVEKSVENPDGVQWEAENVINIFESISSSSSNVIRGIIPLGSCYEPGKFVRVTMGIKPETIQAAGNTEATSKGPFKGYKNIQNSQFGNSVDENSVNDSSSGNYSPYNAVPGYSGINEDF